MTIEIEREEIKEKEKFEMALKFYNSGIIGDNEIAPRLQYFVQKYGPLDETNEIVKEFLVKFRGEE
jgi:hypothetical protein